MPRHATLALIAGILLVVGCPHRSPVWSPDGKRIIILGGAAGEALEKPASRAWIVALDDEGGAASRPRRLAGPGGAGRHYVAAAWLDAATLVVLTADRDADETVEGSGRIWRVALDSAAGDSAAIDEGAAGESWTAVAGPPPSGEHTPRRQPVVIAGKSPRLAYAAEGERVVVIDLDAAAAPAAAPAAKPALEIEQGVLVGPGPEGGFLVYRPNEDTGGLELIAYGADLSRRWARGFGEIATQIAARIGVDRAAVVFNDTSTSIAAGKSIGVSFVFTDVSWNDGVAGFHAILAAADGAVEASSARVVCLPGRPMAASLAGGARLAWAVVPSTERNVRTGSIRAHALHTAPGTAKAPPRFDLELADIRKASLHGYALDGKGGRFAVVVNGSPSRLLLYAASGDKLEKTEEIALE